MREAIADGARELGAALEQGMLEMEEVLREIARDWDPEPEPSDAPDPDDAGEPAAPPAP